jgi:DNA-binding CsgD family transcriptional regulator
MEHLILAVYVLLFASGFAGIGALAALSLRLRSALVPNLAAVLALYTTGLALVLVYYYLTNIVPLYAENTDGIKNTLAVVSSGIQAALYFFAVRIVLKLKAGGRFRPALRLTAACFGALVATEGAVLAIARLFSLPLPGLPVPPAAAAALSYVPVMTAIVLLGFSLLFAPLTGEHGAVKFLARAWAWCLFFMIPLTALEWALEVYGDFFYKPLSVDFLFNFSVDTVSILAFIRSFRSSPLPDETALTFAVGDDTAARFGLTYRERDMVPLIAKGLANKEIAAELGISAATVRTHIYNLFQKVEAKSRIELLNKLKG